MPDIKSCCGNNEPAVTSRGFVFDEKVTGCTCLAPGWCERHRCFKPEHLFELCRRRRDFFQQWEQGQGIGQQALLAPPPKPRIDCVHLGVVVDEIACPTCQGSVRIKVLACEFHQRCTLGRVLDGLACCVTCSDYHSSAHL